MFDKVNQLQWLYGVLDCTRKGFIAKDEFQCLELSYLDRATPMAAAGLFDTDGEATLVSPTLGGGGSGTDVFPPPLWQQTDTRTRLSVFSIIGGHRRRWSSG